ncbi:MAG: hypothetical protein ACD_49C00056G0010 [uncultured bacterium (gcode 4)]|uniref:Uncharacterized protein n=1 Tax=uncultured bacterium (gcode 4) TaxID=1234023 RepID=K2ADX8_9BACT|nr:MAG: hypothetical protein ACD_49C00056G0010 [uncultured bacterium (gcode 4)]
MFLIDWFPNSEDENTYPYPTFPDVESAIKAFTIGKDDNKKEEDLQKWASQEFCSNEIELLSSKTVSRIIKIAETEKLNRDFQTLTLDKPEKIATSHSLLLDVLKISKKRPEMNSYDRFINGEPISKSERDYLITLFKNPEIREIILDTLSKINILYWKENKDFIRRFLENEKWEYDISNPLRCVLHKLENYPFVLDFSFDEITPVKFNVKYPVWWQYFDYKKWNKSGFVVKLDDKLYSVDAIFSKIWIMWNWLIFWSFDLEEDADNKKETAWIFYSFNMMWGFDIIYPAKWITDVYFFEEWLLKSKWENGKFWLLEVTEKDENKETYKDKFEISEILDPSFDEIKSKYWFLLWFNVEKNYNYWKLEIFKYLKADFNQSPIRIKSSVSKLLDKDYVRYYEFLGGSIGVNFYEDWKIIDIETLEWHNFYSLSNDGSALVPIDWLQWFGVEYFSTLEWLFKWEPTFIEDNADNTETLVIFDKASQKFSKLVKWDNLQDRVWFAIFSKLWFAIFEDKKHTYIAYNDWTIFRLKPWYKAYHKNPTSSFCIVKKWFFKNKDLGFIYTEEELLNYADLVLPGDLPIEIK